MISQWFCSVHPHTFLIKRKAVNQWILPNGRFMCVNCLKDKATALNTFNYFSKYQWRKRLNERREDAA